MPILVRREDHSGEGGSLRGGSGLMYVELGGSTLTCWRKKLLRVPGSSSYQRELTVGVGRTRGNFLAGEVGVEGGQRREVFSYMVANHSSEEVQSLGKSRNHSLCVGLV